MVILSGDAAGELGASAVSKRAVDDLKITKAVLRQTRCGTREELRCSARRRAPRDEPGFLPELAEIASQPGVLEWEWRD
jgi:hypothetical protein